MQLKITPVFSKAAIQMDIEKAMEATLKLTLNELYRVGLEFAKEARMKTKDQGSFDDQTGNLRSSIGFIVMYDGKIVNENFELSEGGTEKHEGLNRARAFAEKLSKDSPIGYALILVAGMDYASYVEAKGFDVITGSTLGAYGKMTKVWQNINEALKGIKTHGN